MIVSAYVILYKNIIQAIQTLPIQRRPRESGDPGEILKN
jgi:hypothetical protein